jgi:hypothetical protein
MKVVMKLSVSTVTFSYGAHEEHELPELLAKQWIAAGFAEAVEEAVEEPIIKDNVVVASRRGRKPRAVETSKPDLL